MKYLAAVNLGLTSLIATTAINSIYHHNSQPQPQLNIKKMQANTPLNSTSTTRERDQKAIQAMVTKFQALTDIKTTETNKIIDQFYVGQDVSKEDIGFTSEPENPDGVAITYKILSVNQNGTLTINVILNKGFKNTQVVAFTISGFKTRNTKNREDLQRAKEILDTIAEEYTTTKGDVPSWMINNYPTPLELGIDPVKVEADIFIFYQLISQDEKTGNAIFDINVSKNNLAPLRKRITIKGFLTLAKAEEMIKNKLAEKFPNTVKLPNASPLKAQTPEDAFINLITENDDAKLFTALNLSHADYLEVQTLANSLGFSNFFFEYYADNDQNHIELNIIYSKNREKFTLHEHPIQIQWS